MIRLQLFRFLVCAVTIVAEAARTPKIYNALISSDENLSPSQAYPIVEPVLRTTAVGVTPSFAQPLFQPVVVHPPPPPQPRRQEDAATAAVLKDGSNQKLEAPSSIQKIPTHAQTHILSYNDGYSLYPLAYDPYYQYGYHRDYVYSPLPPLPFYQQPVYVDYGATLQSTNLKPQHQLQPQHQHHLQLQPELQHQPQPELQQPQAELQQGLQQTPGNTINKSVPAADDIESNKEPHRPVPVLPPLQPAPSHLNFKKNPDIPDVIPPLPFTLRKQRKQ